MPHAQRLLVAAPMNAIGRIALGSRRFRDRKRTRDYQGTALPLIKTEL
jgi:hypothetical protein